MKVASSMAELEKMIMDEIYSAMSTAKPKQNKIQRLRFSHSTLKALRQYMLELEILETV